MERGNPRPDDKGESQVAETIRVRVPMQEWGQIGRSSEEVSVIEMERRPRSNPVNKISQRNRRSLWRRQSHLTYPSIMAG